jgi:hypothetical protein
VMSKTSFLHRLKNEWRHLLEEKELLNLCFFFECPSDMTRYNEANSNNCLDNLGPLSLARWRHISEVHVLFPSDIGHIYCAKRADLPHYQEVFSKFLLAFQAYDDRLSVYVYLKGEDYSNHFMTIRNSEDQVKPFVNKIDWMEVHRLATRPKRKSAKGPIEKKRQDSYEDTGFCSSINQTREGASDGISGPRLKPETTLHSEIVNGYRVLSKFISTAGAKWTGSNQRLYFDLDRQRRFASRIHEDNVFECMRLSVTDIHSKCACHRDEHNSLNPAYSAVVGMSVVRNVDGRQVRIAINAQARKSIDESLSRSQMFRPMLSLVLSEYERMPEERKVVSNRLLHGRVRGGMNGFRCIKNPCNMDPMSFYQPLIHYSLLLVSHFGLSFPETVGLISAIEVLPNTSYFFAAAAETLLAIRPNELHRSHRGFAFGYLVAALVLQLRRARPDSDPGVRFNIYWQPELPSGKEWEDRCALKTLACLRFHAAFASLVDKKKRATQYKKLRKHFCSNTENCDLLVTNHVLGICSCIGLLPSWVRGEIEISASSRYMKWFSSKFDLPTGPDTLEQISESLRHALSTLTGLQFSLRIVENVLCKVYRNRTLSRADALFCDLAFWGQTIYSSEGDWIRVSFPDETGLEDIVVKECLISKWAFGNTLLTVDEMIGKLGMSDKGVPTPKEAQNWSVPDALMFGRAKTGVDFDIGHRVVVTCGSFFAGQLRLVSKKLRGSH